MSTTQASEQIGFLLGLPRFATEGRSAYKPGLERMRAVLVEMGNPEHHFDSVLIAGTNGKGTTCAAIAAVLDAAGRKVGLYTSPHLVAVNERIRVGGIAVNDVWLESAISQNRRILEKHGCSFFESVTALAFLYFAESGVETAVVEVGLGGRLDATNVLEPIASAITTVSLDHTEILGDSIARIAYEKASIGRKGRVLAVGPVSEEARASITSTAQAIGAKPEFVSDTCSFSAVETDPGAVSVSVRTPDRRLESVALPLSGSFNAANIAVAVRMVDVVTRDVSDDNVVAGLRDIRSRSGLAGRGDVIRSSPLTYFDVAHNPEGLAAMLTHAARWTAGDLLVIFGCMADKPLGEMSRILGQFGTNVFLVDLQTPRAAKPQQLRPLVERAGATIFGSGSVRDGLARAGAIATMADTILICGSHLLAPDIQALGRKL